MNQTTDNGSATSLSMMGKAGLAFKKWRGGIIAAVILIGIAWFLFAPSPVAVELTKVLQGPMQVSINNQGQIRAHDKYIVAAPVAAELERIALRDGDSVKKGQILAVLHQLPLDARQQQEALARLDSANALLQEAGARVQQTHTEMQLARRERLRIEGLVRRGFVSSQAMDKASAAETSSSDEWRAAQSRQQAAAADVRNASSALIAFQNSGQSDKKQLKLVSPADGYALKVHEISARTVTAGTPLVTIGDTGKYEIVIDVLSTDAVSIHPQDAVLIDGWGGEATLHARVRLVEPQAFTKISALGVEEQRVNVIADPVDALGPLGDGYRIEARIIIWSAPDVVKVPGSSLFRVGDAWHVFVVRNGRAREREVRTGQRNQDETQILSGLKRDEIIIRYPGNQISDGVRVTSAAP